MGALVIVLTIIQLLCALALILVVLFQSGKSAGLSGTLVGNNDTFLARNKNKQVDVKLAKSTKWIGLVFVVLTLILTIIHAE